MRWLAAVDAAIYACCVVAGLARVMSAAPHSRVDPSPTPAPLVFWCFVGFAFPLIVAAGGLAARGAGCCAALAPAQRDAHRQVARGLGVVVLAQAYQVPAISPHRYFNANDVSHIIVLCAVPLLWDGARRLHDTERANEADAPKHAPAEAPEAAALTVRSPGDAPG